MNALSTSSLSTSRRFVLRSRVCRAVVWLLALCFALDGMLIAAKPLAAAVTAGTAVAACHHGAPQPHTAADPATPDCCHGGGGCACASAHALGEVARLAVSALGPVAGDAVRASAVAFVPRDTAPPLRPPIA